VSNLGDCVTLIFERLGFEAPPASYIADVEKLNAAGAEWHKANPGRPVLFSVPDLLGGGGVVTGNLDAAELHGWTGNEAARDFVRYIDERTGRVATLLMLQVLLVIQEAVQARKVNASGGAG
jgi:hypothetical protein